MLTLDLSFMRSFLFSSPGRTHQTNSALCDTHPLRCHRQQRRHHCHCRRYARCQVRVAVCRHRDSSQQRTAARPVVCGDEHSRTKHVHTHRAPSVHERDVSLGVLNLSQCARYVHLSHPVCALLYTCTRMHTHAQTRTFKNTFSSTSNCRAASSARCRLCSSSSSSSSSSSAASVNTHIRDVNARTRAHRHLHVTRTQCAHSRRCACRRALCGALGERSEMPVHIVSIHRPLHTHTSSAVSLAMRLAASAACAACNAAAVAV
jgi:hypothetical protein